MTEIKTLGDIINLSEAIRKHATATARAWLEKESEEFRSLEEEGKEHLADMFARYSMGQLIRASMASAMVKEAMKASKDIGKENMN